MPEKIEKLSNYADLSDLTGVYCVPSVGDRRKVVAAAMNGSSGSVEVTSIATPSSCVVDPRRLAVTVSGVWNAGLGPTTGCTIRLQTEVWPSRGRKASWWLMKIIVHVGTNLVGSRVEREVVIDDSEVEGLSEAEINDLCEDYARDAYHDLIEWGWRRVGDES